MNANFDTLTYSKNLIAAGEKPEVAEIHAHTMRAMIVDELVTKAHLDMRLKEVDMKLEAMENRLTIKLGGIMIAGVSIPAVLMEVL